MAGAFTVDYLSNLLNGNGGNASQSWRNVSGMMNSLSSLTSVNVYSADLGGGFSVNMGVGINYGTNGFGIGMYAGVCYSSKNFSVGLNSSVGLHKYAFRC